MFKTENLNLLRLEMNLKKLYQIQRIKITLVVYIQLIQWQIII